MCADWFMFRSRSGGRNICIFSGDQGYSAHGAEGTTFRSDFIGGKHGGKRCFVRNGPFFFYMEKTVPVCDFGENTSDHLRDVGGDFRGMHCGGTGGDFGRVSDFFQETASAGTVL